MLALAESHPALLWLFLGGIGRSACEGAIIKGGLYLELLSSVDTVAFDKTGTLTFGTPEVISILAADGHTESEVLQIASIAEQRSEHPLGKAIVNKASESELEISAPEEFKYSPGKGKDHAGWQQSPAVGGYDKDFSSLHRTINDLARLDVPALVIHGDADRTVPFKASGEQTAKLVKGARLWP